MSHTQLASKDAFYLVRDFGLKASNLWNFDESNKDGRSKSHNEVHFVIYSITKCICTDGKWRDSPNASSRPTIRMESYWIVVVQQRPCDNILRPFSEKQMECQEPVGADGRQARAAGQVFGRNRPKCYAEENGEKGLVTNNIGIEW
ncbi:hypothetical protein GHT06_017570 [Daphnia sinensis]|uniref:Uncharacterized protein n=1 Tax=Daphnia sinensis TaxID=1820382 RepID=A0AAD5L7W0_9CRUS|nr:hypothetical protein GHT06_017570 [Daphnia sinensis]